MYIIVGLGNPGKKYAITRHNIGFEVIDELARQHHIKVNKIKFKSLIGEGQLFGQKIILVKPQTYMNLSGEAVNKLLKYYQVPLSNLIVIYDDIDIDVGKVRIRKKGSGGSHNGMRNILYLLKDENFPRIRIGVGRPQGRQPLADYVLSRFSKDEQDILIPVVKDSVSAVEVILKDDVDLAMNRYNVK
jgi:PTH1 family peptidyl-tRNA hydrolase